MTALHLPKPSSRLYVSSPFALDPSEDRHRDDTEGEAGDKARDAVKAPFPAVGKQGRGHIIQAYSRSEAGHPERIGLNCGWAAS